MLTGKTAVITGANRGIGFATVEVFAEQGADIWACARTQSDEFESRIKIIAEKNAAVITPIYFDVTEEAAVKNAVKRISKDSQRIDILVNNAGVSIESLFHMTSSEMMEQAMKTNFLSQFFLSQLISRHMMKGRRGSIINIASVSGIEGKQGSIAYGSSKAAVIFYTKTMARELGNYGIRVNSVSPGFIATDMWEGRNSEIKDKILKETSLHRQGTPGEIANIILFLASELSSYITGQNIVADGGRL
ncbi:MAG: SDR family oxidoreductase [Lachnospiraceae bacterium]|nr:SDR family oxidoreductase [Lachnospiraceae bacterium]